MAKVPDFHRDQQWRQVNAAEMSHMAKLAGRVDNVTAIYPLLVRGTDGGLEFSLAKTFVTTIIRDIPVVVKETPTEENPGNTLVVHKVRYKTIPPKPCGEGETPSDSDCGVVMEGERIVAYPDFGHKASDFSGFVSETITDDTVYLRAYFQDGTWRVMMPGGGSLVRYVKIVSLVEGGDGTERAVVGQFLKWSEGDTPTLVDDGEPEDIEVWPDGQAADYEPFIEKTDVFRAELIGGGWVLTWKIRLKPMPLPSGAEIGDCGERPT